MREIFLKKKMGELLVIEILIVVFTTIAYGITRERFILKIDAIITTLFIIIDLILMLAGLQSWLY